MGKAARNRRRRQQQGAPGRPGRDGSTGVLACSAEGKKLLAQIDAETEMPCRATFLDDPVFGSGHPATVTGMTPEGDLITDDSHEAERVPVLLFEPVHAIGLRDPVTGLMHELRTDSLVGAGWQRVPARFVMAALPADGWGLHRTATGVQLCDPYGGIIAEGRPALEPEWVSAAVSTGSVLVFFGPRLGVRVPPGRSPESYTTRARAQEFREGRENGLVVTATVRWNTGAPEETTTWVLLAESVLGPQTPPVAYVPLLNFKQAGGPQTFGFAKLSGFGLEPTEIPAARDLAARLTDVDVDLVRSEDETGGFVVGYLNPAGPDDERFAAWRAAAGRHGHILVITGTRDLLPSEDTGLADILDVIRASHGALVPLLGRSGQRPAVVFPAEDTEDAGDQAEYSDLLTTKLRSQGSFEVYVANTVDLIDRDSLSRWMTNLWPVVCQTCGEPLGTKADISADGPDGGTKVRLSMHHSACRPSGTTPAAGPAMHQPTSSFVVGYLADASGEPKSTNIPVMVVNPSCEQLLLERAGNGGWRNATLDEFTSLGLAPATGNLPPRIPQIHAALDDGHLSVTADTPTRHEWAVDPPAHVCEQLRRHRGFAISLTTKALPTLLALDDLPGAFTDPEAVVGWVDLARPPRPRRGRTTARLPSMGRGT